MTHPTPRDAVTGDTRRLQAVNDAMAGIDDIGKSSIDDALARLETIHQALMEVLNPGTGREKEAAGGGTDP